MALIRAGLSQSDLAREADLSPGYVSKVVRGDRDVSQKVIEAAERLGLDWSPGADDVETNVSFVSEKRVQYNTSLKAATIRRAVDDVRSAQSELLRLLDVIDAEDDLDHAVQTVRSLDKDGTLVSQAAAVLLALAQTASGQR